jgi:hypothetical protein
MFWLTPQVTGHDDDAVDTATILPGKKGDYATAEFVTAIDLAFDDGIKGRISESLAALMLATRAANTAS